MDLLGKYPEMENGNHYALTIICLLTSFVNIVPIKDKKTETIINAYIKYICADEGGSQFTLSDNGKEFSSSSMAYITGQLGFTKVYTSPYSPHSNSVVERFHSFLKNSIRKMRCNHETDWDLLAHIAMMVYNIFPHTAAGESPFFLMYGWEAYLPTLHNLLQPKLCYMGDDECKIHLDIIREVYMLAVLNKKMSNNRYPPPTGNPHNEELKIGDLVLIKNQTPQAPFNAKYKPSYKIIKRIGDKSFDVQGPTGEVKRVSAWQLQFMYPAEYYVTVLPQMEMFGRTAKFINHPSLMPDLYEASLMTGTQLWIKTVLTKSTRNVALGHPQSTPQITIWDQVAETLCM